MKPKLFEWKRRRRIIYASLIFCAAVVAYLSAWGQDGMLTTTIITTVGAYATLVANAYILGAAWQDTTEIKYQPTPEPHDALQL